MVNRYSTLRRNKGLRRTGIQRNAGEWGTPGAAPQRTPLPPARPHQIPAKLRSQLEERADWQCEATAFGCVLERGKGHAHHRKKRSQGGEDTLDNLILVCRFHHFQIHNGIDSYTRGLLVRRDDDPADIPVVRYGIEVPA